MSAYNKPTKIDVTLDNLLLLRSVWKFIGVKVYVRNCHFAISSSTPVHAGNNSEQNSKYIDSGFQSTASIESLEYNKGSSVLEFIGTTARITLGTFSGRTTGNSLITVNHGSHVTIERSNFTENQVVNGTIYVDNNSALILRQCRFSRNRATQNGGCVLLQHHSNMSVYSTSFLDNTAENSGEAIMSRYNTQIKIKDKSLFEGNMASAQDSFGGAIANFNNVTLKVIDSVFKDNHCNYQGGAISAVKTCKIFLSNTTFHNNSATDSSGAIRCYYNCVMKVNSSTFKNNVANDGGGIESVNATLEFDNCTFQNNTSLVTDTGALTAVSNSTVKIKNCVFHDNTASRYGPAMEFYGAVTVYIENSNFTDNFGQYGAGAIYAESNITIYIKGSYFVNNTANRGGGAMIGGLTTTL